MTVLVDASCIIDPPFPYSGTGETTKTDSSIKRYRSKWSRPQQLTLRKSASQLGSFGRPPSTQFLKGREHG